MCLNHITCSQLDLKPSKCTFGARELDYLGFRISEGIFNLGRKVRAKRKKIKINHLIKTQRTQTNPTSLQMPLFPFGTTAGDLTERKNTRKVL